ncbi:MAG: hypothetical protein V7709_16545 [Halioglobus sp.]
MQLPLMKELAPRQNPHLMMLSLMGLTIHHLEANKLVAYLPGCDVVCLW